MIHFGIIAHDDTEHLLRLAAALYPYPVYIHIDARRSVDIDNGCLREAPNVQLVESRVRVNWGGWSLVEAIANLFRQIIVVAGSDDQVVLLSGHCYPVLNVHDIVGRIEASPRPIHLRMIPLAAMPDRSRAARRHPYDLFPVRRDGLAQIVFAAGRRVFRGLERMFPDRPYASDLAVSYHWGVFPVWVVRDVFLPELPVLRTEMRWMQSPEEVAIATSVVRAGLLNQTPLGAYDEYVSDQVAHYPTIHVNDQRDHQETRWWFTDEDLGRFDAGDALFVRKVSTVRSSKLLDEIDARAGRLNASRES